MPWNRRTVVLAGVLAALPAPLASAENRRMAGADHIQQMAGCFEVTYRYFEDGEHDFFSPDYGLDEPITLQNEITARGPRAITITNYAFRGDGRMAHWHMVWAYLADEGVWRQTIWGRGQGSKNREFRYTCEGTWSKNRWVCDAGTAPKPFRDDGAPFGFLRNDYASLDRRNTIVVTPDGWAMTQQNAKLTDSGETVAYETGWILYERQAASHCRTEPDTGG